MQNLLLLSVSSGAVFAVGLVAGFCALFSRLVVELLVLPVQLFSRSAGFSVSRSSFLRSLLHRAPLVFSCGCFAPFHFLRFVAVVSSNPTLKRDCAKARSPLLLR